MTSSKTDSEIKSELPKHWVAAIFKKMQARYIHKWTSSIDGIEEIAVDEWSKALAGLDADAIKRGLDSMAGSWPPSAPEFAELCRNGGDDCVPPLNAAWHIICNAHGAGGDLADRYVHPALLAMAGHKLCDVYSWSRLPERRGVEHFRLVYDTVMRRIRAGEVFTWPPERERIADKTKIAVTPAEITQARIKAIAAINKIRAKLSRGMPRPDWRAAVGMRKFV